MREIMNFFILILFLLIILPPIICISDKITPPDVYIIPEFYEDYFDLCKEILN
jgi:hypothetical protein